MAMTTRKLNKAIDYYKAGHSVGETAKLVGVHETTIYRQFYRLGIIEQPEGNKEKYRAKLSDKDKKELVKKYESGATLVELEQEYKVSRNSIYYLINKHSKPRNKIDDKAIKKAIKMHQSKKYSVNEILEQTGVSRATFYRKLKEYKKSR